MTESEVVEALLEASQAGGLDEALETLTPFLCDAVVFALKHRVDQEKLQNASRALQTAELAAAVAARVQSPGAEARAAWALGNAVAHLTRFHDALRHYQRAEQLLAGRASPLERVALRINQIAMLEELGEYHTAIALAEQTRPLCHSLGEAGDVALAALEMNLGAAYEQQGELLCALEAFRRGQVLALAHGDRVTTARLYVNEANVLKQLDLYELAAQRFLEARAMLVEADLGQEVARVDLNLGRLSYRRGLHQVALRQLSAARAGFAAIPNPSEVAVVELHQAMVYRGLNLPRESLSLAEAATTHFRQADTRHLSALARSLEGLACWRLGAMERARSCLLEAHRLWEEQAPLRALELNVERALLALEAGLPAEALELARSVLEGSPAHVPPTLRAKTHLVLARVWQAMPPPDLDRAQAHAQAGLTLAETFELRELSLYLHVELGRLAERSGAPEQGLVHYQIALERLEVLRGLLTVEELQLGYMDDKLTVHERVVRLCLERGMLPEALETLNRAHGGRIPLRSGLALTVDPALELELQRLREAWQWFHRSADESESALPGRFEVRPGHGAPSPTSDRVSLERALGELQRRRAIQQETSEGAASASAAFPPGHRLLERLDACLSAHEGLVVYLLVEGAVHALTLTRAGLRSWRLPATRAGLQRWQRAWRLQVESGERARGAATVRLLLERLHGDLIAPLWPLLCGLERLFVVLPPTLHDLPLAAARGDDHHLLERLTLVHLSAPEALAVSHRAGIHLSVPASSGEGRGASSVTVGGAGPGDVARSALVIGHSDGGRLPEAVREARLVAAALARHHRVAHLEESAATLDAFRHRAERAGLLHLATHAVFRPDNPFFSWIRLEQARMTVAEVYELSLPQRPLVVLSACETGRSEARGGGLLGLGRALLAAGASGLVVSRWQVVDGETSALMQTFYQRLRDIDPASVADALRQAQRIAIAHGQDPRHWGAFLHMQG